MDNEKYKYKVITVPNVLSFIRVLLIPVFVWYYTCRNNVTVSIIVLAVSAFTDIADGFIARKFRMVSNVGRILDPAADKFTQLAVMTCLCVNYHRMILPLSFLVIKEVANGVIGLIMMHRNRDALDSQWHGKLATVIIYLTGVIHLVWMPRVPDVVSYSLIGLCVAIMILSFVLYTIRNFRIIKGEEAK